MYAMDGSPEPVVHKALVFIGEPQVIDTCPCPVSADLFRAGVIAEPQVIDTCPCPVSAELSTAWVIAEPQVIDTCPRPV